MVWLLFRCVIFLSDPNWTSQTGNVWRADTNGEVSLAESGMSTTNRGVTRSNATVRWRVGQW